MTNEEFFEMVRRNREAEDKAAGVHRKPSAPKRSARGDAMRRVASMVDAVRPVDVPPGVREPTDAELAAAVAEGELEIKG